MRYQKEVWNSQKEEGMVPKSRLKIQAQSGQMRSGHPAKGAIDL